MASFSEIPPYIYVLMDKQRTDRWIDKHNSSAAYCWQKKQKMDKHKKYGKKDRQTTVVAGHVPDFHDP